MEAILSWISTFFQKVIDVLLWVPKKLVELGVDGLIYIYDMIPVPDFISNAGSFWSQVPSGVWYFADAAALGYGMSVIISAYTIRFLIRRLPIIG